MSLRQWALDAEIRISIVLMLSTVMRVSFMIITRIVRNVSVVVNVYSTVLIRPENGLRAQPESPTGNTLRYMKAQDRQNTTYSGGLVHTVWSSLDILR